MPDLGWDPEVAPKRGRAVPRVVWSGQGSHGSMAFGLYQAGLGLY